MYYKFAPTQKPDGTIPPASCNDGVAGSPSAPAEEPIPVWQEDIEKNALADAIRYLRNDANKSLDTILICRWPVTRARALEIISQARATIAAETEPTDLVGYFREKEKS